MKHVYSHTHLPTSPLPCPLRISASRPSCTQQEEKQPKPTQFRQSLKVAADPPTATQCDLATTHVPQIGYNDTSQMETYMLLQLQMYMSIPPHILRKGFQLPLMNDQAWLAKPLLFHARNLILSSHSSTHTVPVETIAWVNICACLTITCTPFPHALDD